MEGACIQPAAFFGHRRLEPPGFRSKRPRRGMISVCGLRMRTAGGAGLV